MPKQGCPHDGTHDRLAPWPSSYAANVGFALPPAEKRAAATTEHGQVKKAKADGVKEPNELTFPAPLVLPDDDLASDPRWPAQSLRSWIREKERNEVTDERRTIYLASAPKIAASARFVQNWARAQTHGGGEELDSPPASLANDVLDYLTVFYHGMPVKPFKTPLEFVSWSDKPKSGKKAINETPQYIGLKTGTEIVGIRTRASRDRSFLRQLNLNDLLDAAIEMLPPDAYALLMIVDHDLYENEQDDFTCGRAYGGSRIAVVSIARYNPAWDASEGVDRAHAWPASHCHSYMEDCVLAAGGPIARPGKAAYNRRVTKEELATPLYQAKSAMVRCFQAQATNAWTSEELGRLWRARVCRTASHELGHCLALDHCVYYACIMQGTAGLAEDMRQPPYLCPVDLAKVLRATGADERERYEAMVRLCESKGWAEEPMFAAYAAWIRALPVMKSERQVGKRESPECIVIN